MSIPKECILCNVNTDLQTLQESIENYKTIIIENKIVILKCAALLSTIQVSDIDDKNILNTCIDELKQLLKE